jgi:hypothetical protein
MGDQTVHGGSIILGCTTVLIGAGGMDPSAIAGMASKAAAAAKSVATEAAAQMDKVSEANDQINALLDQDNLTDAQQTQLDELNESYGDSIEGMGMNEEGFKDWS